MDPDSQPAGAINGINLANYFPNYRTYNSVIYVHKKFLIKEKEKKEKEQQKEKEKEKVKEQRQKDKKAHGKEKKPKRKNKSKQDKSSQFNGEYHCQTHEGFNNYTVKVGINNESLMEQTIKFAKNLVPLIIPQNADNPNTPVFYTIETSAKSKKKTQKTYDNNKNKDDNTYKKEYKREKSKKLCENYRNEKIMTQRESVSVKETVSFSSQNNTLDDVHIHPSLCCTFSDTSEKKQYNNKRERAGNKFRQTDLIKLVPSESFEALATEMLNCSGDNKIKIHLMNNTDKCLLSENIKIPVINAIKECLSELNNHNNLNTELVTVQKILKYNTQKVDYIIDKLTCIEEKLDNHIKTCAIAKKSPKVETVKTSTLERLGEDLIEIQENSFNENEYFEEETYIDRKRVQAMQLTPKQVNDKAGRSGKNECFGDGEEGLGSGNTSILNKRIGVKPDRVNRVPARFCWTDAVRKNVS